MDRRALLIALGVAGLGVLCLSLYMRRFEAETSGGPKVQILIAARDIKLGEVLTQEMIGVRGLPQAYVEQRHVRFSDLATVVGARVSMAVGANESIQWSDIASMKAERRILSGLVEPGMRALTINARRESVFAGLLRPGDRVDIVYSRQSGAAQGTIVLLQNVVVLAVGVDTGGTDRNNSVGTAVTISVSTEQAQLLIHARSEGTLDAVLRNPEDVVVIKDLPDVGTADVMEPERRQRFARRTLQTPGDKREIDRVR